jgi:hypothetical protein
MWSFEHSLESRASAAEVFRLWSDVPNWPTWDEGLEKTELDGPFAAGTPGRLTPAGQSALPFSIVEVRPGVGFSDETPIPGATLRFIHCVEEAGAGRVKITHRVEIDGPAADEIGATMGAELAEGMPHTVAALAALAERRQGA